MKPIDDKPSVTVPECSCGAAGWVVTEIPKPPLDDGVLLRMECSGCGRAMSARLNLQATDARKVEILFTAEPRQNL